MQQRCAGKTVRGSAFSGPGRAVRATTVQVFNRRTTATRPRHGRTTAVQPCYHRRHVTRRGTTALMLRGASKSATSLRCAGTTTRPLHSPCWLRPGAAGHRSTALQTSHICKESYARWRESGQPYDRCVAATGPLRDCTSLAQLCDRGEMATRSQHIGTTLMIRSSTTTRLQCGNTTTRLLCCCVAEMQLQLWRSGNKTAAAECGGDTALQCSSDTARQCCGDTRGESELETRL